MPQAGATTAQLTPQQAMAAAAAAIALAAVAREDAMRGEETWERLPEDSLRRGRENVSKQTRGLGLASRVKLRRVSFPCVPAHPGPGQRA